MKRWLHNAIVVKVALSVGFIVYLLVPPEWDKLAGLSINFLWLWKA